MIGATKKFNGKTYKSLGIFSAKVDATKRFKSLKEQGYSARITREKMQDMGFSSVGKGQWHYVVWGRR
jgi:hypothetical protein